MPTVNIRYCLTCGYSAIVYSDGSHIVASHTAEEVPSGPVYQYDNCFGPFAYCPPPDDLQENWQNSLSVPPADELFKINNQFDYDFETDKIVQVNLI